MAKEKKGYLLGEKEVKRVARMSRDFTRAKGAGIHKYPRNIPPPTQKADSILAKITGGSGPYTADFYANG